MTPGTAELQARSLALALEATYRALGARWTHTLAWLSNDAAEAGNGITLRRVVPSEDRWYVDFASGTGSPMGPSYSFGSLSAARDYLEREITSRKAMPWPPDEEQPRDPELPPEDPDEDDELPEFVHAHGREDDSPLSCLSCEDEGGYFQPNGPWLDCAEPDCPARQRRREEAEDGAVEFGDLATIENRPGWRWDGEA